MEGSLNSQGIARGEMVLTRIWRSASFRIEYAIRQVVKKQSFEPTFLGVFVNPFFFARRGLRKHVGDLAPQIGGATLDVGAGTQPYRKLFEVPEYVSLEYDTPQNRAAKRADAFYDGETFPFPDDRFDSVVLFEVLEHVFNPDRFLSEIHRVLKPGGVVLITVPMVWDEHEQPYDYARYSSFGLAHLLNKQGFNITVHKKSVDDVSVIFQLLNTYLHKKLIQGKLWRDLILTLLFMAPVNIVGVTLAAILPRNADLYLDNIVLANKKLP